MTQQLEVLTATPVPFDQKGDIALGRFAAQIHRIEPHVQVAFVGGTTGEFPALEESERHELLRIAVDAFGPARVVAHIGAPSTRQVTRLAESAANLGITRMALLTPYYLPCGFAEIHDFYATIAGRFPAAQIYAYVFPERTGIDVSPAELGELTKIDGVVGAKLSGRPNERFEDYVAAVAPGAHVYSGDDGQYPRFAAAGGAGIVSGVSSLIPELYGQLTEALRAGNTAAAEALQEKVLPVVHACGPSITRLKYGIARRYGEQWGSRMPLPAVPEDVRVVIDALQWT